MEISFFGANCLRITGRDIAVLVDPYQGMPELKQKNEATLLTQAFKGAAAPNAGMVIDSPGEYEISGSMVTGVPAQLHIDESGKNGTVYSVVVDDVRIGVLEIAELSDQQVEELGQIDVLAIPVGGHGLTLDATAAAKIISQLEPRYVIPTHYDDGKTKYDVPQDKLEVFLKETGSSPEPVAKLKTAARDMPLETTVVVLERSGISPTMRLDSKIPDFLNRAELGVISSLGSDGQPQSAVVGVTSFADGLELVFNTSKKSRKFRNISTNPRASLAMWREAVTVQCDGEIEVIASDDPRLPNYQKRIFEVMPFKQKLAADPDQAWLIFRPHWIRYTDIKQHPLEIIEQDFSEN